MRQDIYRWLGDERRWLEEKAKTQVLKDGDRRGRMKAYAGHVCPMQPNKTMQEYI